MRGLATRRSIASLVSQPAASACRVRTSAATSVASRAENKIVRFPFNADFEAAATGMPFARWLTEIRRLGGHDGSAFAAHRRMVAGTE